MYFTVLIKQKCHTFRLFGCTFIVSLIFQTRDVAEGDSETGAKSSSDVGGGVEEYRRATESGLDTLHDARTR